jgi:rhomboid family GlyGly-CTERM serine protease
VHSLVRQIFAVKKLPWIFLGVALAAVITQLNAPWRDLLLFDRNAITHGEWWRIWTGHLIHFGWPHFIADVGLFVILGRLLEWQHPWLVRIALVSMPAVISAAVYWFDPAMNRYGGLSAVNIGLLLFLACKGWQKSWVDWFWPAVLAIYIAEIVLEATRGRGHGGGMIQFDDPSIRVATVAHLGGSLFGVLAWLATFLRCDRAQTVEKTKPSSVDHGTP